MEKVYKLPNRKAITEEAVDWLIKLDGDEPPTRADLAALTEWLSRSPVHRQELNAVNAFWSNTILTELVVPLGKHDTQPRPGLLAGLFHGFRGGRHDTQRNRWGYGGLAAASAALVLGIALALSLWLAPDPWLEANGPYLTAVGQQKTIALADGSRVQLNTNSQIEVDYGEQYRNVHLLQGEVHFDIAKYADRPFRVYAGGRRVEAVGTAFTVYYEKDKDLNVLVTEGTVALASLDPRPLYSDSLRPGSSHTGSSYKSAVKTVKDRKEFSGTVSDTHSKSLGLLKAGQGITLKVAENTQSTEAEKTPPKAVQIDADELARRLAWREGVLMFSGDPLERVVDEISRYTTLSIEIADPALRDIQIGGRFKVGEMDDVFNALETNFGLQVIHLGYNRVRLAAAPR